jgi:malonate transporter and related proteins
MANTILLALAPVFCVMGFGFGAGKLHLANNAQVDGLNALVMDFALPASLLVATASASRSQMFAQAPLFAVLGAVMLLTYLGWYFLRRSSSKPCRADASLQALTIAFPNLAGVGLPIASAVLGSAGAVPVAAALAAGSILVTPLSLVQLEINRGREGGVVEGQLAQVTRALRRALTKPVVVAPALGILFSLSDWKLGPVAAACLTLIGQAAAGVALFLTGLILSAQSFRLDWKVLGATGMANIMRPVLAAVVAVMLHLSPEATKTAALLAAVPSGFFGILFAINYRLDSATTGSMVIASTVSSIITMAIAIAVLFPR